MSSLLKRLLLLVLVNLSISKDIDNKNEVTKISVRLKDDNNDTIIEIFHQCTCIAYYMCPEINQYMIAVRAGVLKKPLQCSDDTYVCCKNSSVPTVSTQTETTMTATIPSTVTLKRVEISEIPESEKPRNVDVTCGLLKTNLNVRILTSEVDSANTISGEVPWIVEIFEKRQDTNQPYRFKCTGSLIHPKVILTAQHCVRSTKEQKLKVLASGSETFQNLGNPKTERNVFKIIKHPAYYSGGLYNDIAVLILEEKYDYSDNPINSICLPRSDQMFNGTKCLGVGWGTNPDLKSIPLKKVDIPVVEFGECQNLLRKSRLGEDFNLHSSFMCAGGEEGKDTCKGDGGGPLICMQDYTFYQAGIVSWGVDSEKCGVAGEPGLYTDVTKFRDWIIAELDKYNITID